MPTTSNPTAIAALWFDYDASDSRLRQVSFEVHQPQSGPTEFRATTTLYLDGYEYVRFYKSTTPFDPLNAATNRVTEPASTHLYKIQKRHALGGAGQFTLTTLVSGGVHAAATAHYRLFHGDHLGSQSLVTTAGNGSAAAISALTASTVVEAHLAFDSWGQRIEGGTGTLQPRPAIAEDIRSGFTGHEMLDTLGLVHMNGRLYDPFVGQFLSPDPVIQDITDSQAFNAYSYVRNNPLSSIDPTGYSWVSKFFKKLNKGVQKFLKAVSKIHPLAKLHAKADKWVYQNRVIITVVVVAVVAAIYVAPAVAGWAGSISGLGLGTNAAYAVGVGVAGAVSGGARTALYGGKLRDVLKSAAISGLTAAISAGVLHPVGVAAENASGFAKIALTASHVAGHGVVGGAANAAQGGSFKEGFLSAAASSFVFHVPGVGQVLNSTGLVGIASRTALAAAVGGTVAEIGGGKFGNGAWTAAFQHLYNNEAGRWFKHVRMEALASDQSLKRAFLINRKASDLGLPGDISDGESMWRNVMNKYPGAKYYDISKGELDLYAKNSESFGKFDFVGVVDHGANGDQWFMVSGGLAPDSQNWAIITSGIKSGGACGLFGCYVAGGNGPEYLRQLALSARAQSIAVIAGETGYLHRIGRFDVPGTQVTSQYQGSNNLRTESFSFSTPYKPR